ncbi:MAG: tRNA-dihydrouridine synthase family protein [Synergistaceae bacterium]|jgi:tRNA-dihydrouridine synthase B|nr:tRNA-dihydrouridine synthase family protein [Synergistaceae bacterium]
MRADLEIGGARVSSPIWLAPLAGVTTRTFRDFHKKLGAALVHTEMISAVGLSYKNKRTRRLIGDEGEGGPIALQLFSPDAASLAKGAAIALGLRRFDALEINMACPMPKVAKKGSGASLLGRPDVAGEMVSALKPFGLPAWVKMRILDQASAAASSATERFCETILAAGADLVMIHGRTAAQRYEGAADKEKVREVATLFPGRVAASGDYYAPEDAALYLDGGCVAVLAARGVLRDEFLIPKTLRALGYETPRNLTDPTAGDVANAIVALGREGLENEGERFTLVLVKRMLAGLFKGFPGAAVIRADCAACRDWASLEETLLRVDLHPSCLQQ